jgi:hypothetical protein
MRQLDSEEVECEQVCLGLPILFFEKLFEVGTTEEDAIGVSAVEKAGRLFEVFAAEEAHHGLQAVGETEAHFQLHAEGHQQLSQLQEGKDLFLDSA